MPNITFHIDKSKVNKQGFAPIIANIAIANKNHPKVIERVKPRYWSKKKRVSPPRESEPGNRHIQINALIDDYTNKAKTFFNECLIKDIPITEKTVVDFLNGKIYSKSKNCDIDPIFLKFIDFIGRKTSPNTLKKHNNTHTFLIDYQSYAKIKLTFDDVDLNFFEKLRDYAVIEKHRKNTFFTYISNLKRFLGWAKEEGYYFGKAHEKFKVESENITHISLTFDELKKLYYYNFDTPKLDQVRNLFCFGCLTGFRTGDIMILRRDHIKNRFIEFTLQKTTVEVVVPIVAAAQRILDKCKDPVMLFQKISYPSYLEHLKKCCELAGIEDMTEKVSHLANNLPVRIQKKKCDLITGHTSRKTFVKLSRNLDVDEDVVKSITGHRGDRIFSKYNEVDRNRKLYQMDEAWRVLYQAPGAGNEELTEIDKLKKEIEDLKKIIELQISNKNGTLTEK